MKTMITSMEDIQIVEGATVAAKEPEVLRRHLWQV